MLLIFSDTLLVMIVFASYHSKSTPIKSTAGDGQICTTLRQGRRLLQVLCQCLEPELLGDGSQQVGEGGAHPGQHHEELQEEEEGSMRGVQGGGCVHHEEHSHWPGLDLENKLIIVQYPLWPGSVHLSATVQGGTQGGWPRPNV